MLRKQFNSFVESCRMAAHGTPEDHAALAAVRAERNRVAEEMPQALAQGYAQCAQVTGRLAVTDAQKVRHEVYEQVTGEFTAVPPQQLL